MTKIWENGGTQVFKYDNYHNVGFHQDRASAIGARLPIWTCMSSWNWESSIGKIWHVYQFPQPLNDKNLAWIEGDLALNWLLYQRERQRERRFGHSYNLDHGSNNIMHLFIPAYIWDIVDTVLEFELMFQYLLWGEWNMLIILLIWLPSYTCIGYYATSWG